MSPELVELSVPYRHQIALARLGRACVLSCALLAMACTKNRPFVGTARAVPVTTVLREGGLSSGLPADILFVADTHASNGIAPHKTISDGTAMGERLTHVAVRPPHMDIWGQQILAWILAHNQDARLVVHLGDAANIGCTNELERFLAVMRAAKKPWVMAPGNHDSLMLGNFPADRFEGPHWAQECQTRGDGADEHMDKNEFLSRYIAAHDWTTGKAVDGECKLYEDTADNVLPRVERAIVCSYFDSPHASFAVQQVAVDADLTLVVVDTAVYARPPSLLHAGGTQGGIGAQQPVILDQWLADEQRRSHPRSIVFAGHFALDHLDQESQGHLTSLFSSYSVLGYISAHEHDPTKQLLHPDPKDGNRSFPELNVASTLDWPMEYVRSAFVRRPDSVALELEVVSAAAELDTAKDSDCTAAAKLTGTSGTARWRVEYEEVDDYYTSYVPYRWYRSLLHWLGNRAYDELRAHMYQRLGRFLGLSEADIDKLTDAETHTDRLTANPKIARYERCQVRWASEEERRTRRGPSGKEIEWSAPTRATRVRPSEATRATASWTWNPGALSQ